MVLHRPVECTALIRSLGLPIPSSSRFEYFLRDETSVASVAIKAFDKLLQRRFAKIFGSNVVHAEICNVS